MPHTPPPPGPARRIVCLCGVAVLLALGCRIADVYLNDPDIPRPVDYLQVWSAGRLTLAGGNPYDADQMFALQAVNRAPAGYASMMWVPPWGLAVAVPVGALPIGVGQLVWVMGQLALIVAAGVVLWRLYGGPGGRWWVPVALVLGSAPVWLQTVGGQYAGLLLWGLVGFLVAHRANRPGLAGAAAALTALKPHLLALFGLGLLIDAVRTRFGRRVVFGGIVVLAAAAAAVTAINPGVWAGYLAATTGPGPGRAPGLADWFNPTTAAWVRHAVPGRPFWVQCVPVLLASAAFGVYWWRRGGPERWPDALLWVVPVSLLIAPYGGWPCDLTLLMVPVVGVAARLDARGWDVPGRWVLAGVYTAANVAALGMTVAKAPPEAYVWLSPVLAGCIAWAARPPRPASPAPPAGRVLCFPQLAPAPRPVSADARR